MIRRLTIVMGMLLLASCAGGAPDTACQGTSMTETKLFFGLSIPEGGTVSERQWTAFVDKEIVPVFSEGFTVADGQGFWKDSQTALTITERSKMVIRVHGDDEASEQGITRIIDRYKAEFKQQSVMRVDAPSCVFF
ncbi:DUF3574 domain-containing protein [Aestuariispira insulae]|uniref:Uncharacterized protein DUF3574 n=1 Tax=Aestuariispira insulae TaxID=1461337 RepID=A0A3D9HTW7_9PROT|nr:DUF3574 domain-containing protein [Aestuariispira insulae]RED52316.1 uncharacterized protein DUF3574 [Aestuariispira insulae]